MIPGTAGALEQFERLGSAAGQRRLSAKGAQQVVEQVVRPTGLVEELRERLAVFHEFQAGGFHFLAGLGFAHLVNALDGHVGVFGAVFD